MKTFLEAYTDFNKKNAMSFIRMLLRLTLPHNHIQHTCRHLHFRYLISRPTSGTVLKQVHQTKNVENVDFDFDFETLMPLMGNL